MVAPAPPTEAGGELHATAPSNSWPWLPTRRGGPILRHPYCAACGLVKFVGTDRALDAGGMANYVARLERRLQEGGYVSTEVQRRLILRALEGLRATDPFGLSRQNQFGLVAKIMSRFLGIPLHVVQSYQRSC